MLRQASSRNQRARGFRLKHAVQMGILITASVWLVYQVKHSEAKKRAYDAHNSKFTSKAIEDQEDFFKFGRKDLTRTEKAVTVTEIHKEDKSKGVQEEEEEEDPEMKQEELEMDRIDEQDQPDEDEESDRGDDSAEEVDKAGQMEEMDIFDSQDHEGGTLAREENYKRDDVSGAVVHNANATESEIVTGDARSMDEEVDGFKVVGAGDTVVDRTVDGFKGDNGTTGGSVNNLSNNGTATNSTESDARVSNTDNAAVSNSTIAKENVQTDLLTNSTQQMNATDESDTQIKLSANTTASVSKNQTEGRNNATAVELPAEMQMPNSTDTLDSAQRRNTTVGNALNQAEMSNSTVPYSEDHSTPSSSTNGNGETGTGETGDLSRAVTKEELSVLPNIQKGATTVDEDAAE